ncbi:hypothetical protein KCP70_12130 [Salmonella enterica subsp. enterica]|nr:hypothetical protein KCP70_12130 [Salmonella enterica subsp. enterica]
MMVMERIWHSGFRILAALEERHQHETAGGTAGLKFFFTGFPRQLFHADMHRKHFCQP